MSASADSITVLQPTRRSSAPNVVPIREQTPAIPPMPQGAPPSIPQHQKKQIERAHIPSNLSISTVPTPEKNATLGSKIKKAFIFGKKESKKPSDISSNSGTSERSNTFSSFSFKKNSNGERSNTLTSLSFTRRQRSTTTLNSVMNEDYDKNSFDARLDADANSLVSSSSTSSSVSFSTLRRMGKSIFKKKIEKLEQQQPPHIAQLLPFAGTNNTGGTSLAKPVVTHSVVEAEIASTTATATISSSSFMTKINTPPSPILSTTSNIHSEEDSSSSSDPIPSLTSSTEGSSSNSSEEPIEEEVTAGETVFPKKLDLLTVETIRSSLERTKSLERRRSKRSTKSSKSIDSTREEEEEETITNATTIHIHEDPEQVQELNKDVPAPKSILKTESADDGESATTAAAPATALVVANAGPTTLLDFDMGPDFALDFNLEKASRRESEPELEPSFRYPPKPLQQQEPPYERDTTNTRSTEEQQLFHLHPLYQKRISQFVPSHGNNQFSDSSISSSFHHRNSSSIAESTVSSLSNSSTIAKSKRTVTFSSRIIVYDTFNRVDYDRRAELATCNRLTPMLAQQIKEELNNFKMEMEIHADSRIYTHFI